MGPQVLGLLVFLAASALVAGLGGLATANNVNGWYATADKAPWSPPNWVFGPVWTLLYTAMAVAAWLVWRRRAEGTRPALTAYAVQLVLNLLWTPVFFGLYPVLGTPGPVDRLRHHRGPGRGRGRHRAATSDRSAGRQGC